MAISASGLTGLTRCASPPARTASSRARSSPCAREEDDRQRDVLVVLADVLREVEAADVGQVDVHQDQVGPELRRAPRRSAAARRRPGPRSPAICERPSGSRATGAGRPRRRARAAVRRRPGRRTAAACGRWLPSRSRAGRSKQASAPARMASALSRKSSSDRMMRGRPAGRSHCSSSPSVPAGVLPSSRRRRSRTTSYPSPSGSTRSTIAPCGQGGVQLRRFASAHVRAVRTRVMPSWTSSLDEALLDAGVLVDDQDVVSCGGRLPDCARRAGVLGRARRGPDTTVSVGDRPGACAADLRGCELAAGSARPVAGSRRTRTAEGERCSFTSERDEVLAAPAQRRQRRDVVDGARAGQPVEVTAQLRHQRRYRRGSSPGRGARLELHRRAPRPRRGTPCSNSRISWSSVCMAGRRPQGHPSEPSRISLIGRDGARSCKPGGVARGTGRQARRRRRRTSRAIRRAALAAQTTSGRASCRGAATSAAVMRCSPTFFCPGSVYIRSSISSSRIIRRPRAPTLRVDGRVGDRRERVGRERELDPLVLHQLLVLLDERVARLGEHAHQRVAVQRLERGGHRQPARRTPGSARTSRGRPARGRAERGRLARRRRSSSRRGSPASSCRSAAR